MDSCDTQGKREPAEESLERRTLHDFGYFGHFLHVYEGGRGGKQHILSKLYYRDGHLTQRELLEATSISSAALSEEPHVPRSKVATLPVSSSYSAS